MADLRASEQAEDVQGFQDEGVSTQDDLASEAATGMGLNQEKVDNLSDDMSDTGWDTDLDVEEEKEEYDATGKKSYIQSCKTLGIIPASYFTRKIQAGETHICMNHHGIGPKGAKAVAIALTSNTSVTHLDLSDNGLGTEGIIAITSMLKENCYITYLDLSDNDAGPPAAYAILVMTASNSTLIHLLLRGNGFNDSAAEPLAETIRTSYHIKHIDLSHNEFSEAAGQVLGPAIGDSETVQILDLSWNHLRRKGAEAIAEGLKVNNILKELYLAYNGFSDKGMIALADALKVNTILEVLDVSNNRISHEGAAAISKVIPSHDSLQTLRIGKNPLQSVGVAVLLNAILASTSTTFQCLDCNGITITLDIEKTINEMKKSHAHLKITHGGIGGHKAPKPLLPPVAKLVKYCKENNVVLLDLFRLFDKEQQMVLSEEEFRNALKHISSPLMEFERLKLINEFKTSPSSPNIKLEEKGAKSAPPPAEGEGSVFIDYMLLVGVAQGLESS